MGKQELERACRESFRRCNAEDLNSCSGCGTRISVQRRRSSLQRERMLGEFRSTRGLKRKLEVRLCTAERKVLKVCLHGKSCDDMRVDVINLPRVTVRVEIAIQVAGYDDHGDPPWSWRRGDIGVKADVTIDFFTG